MQAFSRPHKPELCYTEETNDAVHQEDGGAHVPCSWFDGSTQNAEPENLERNLNHRARAGVLGLGVENIPHQRAAAVVSAEHEVQGTCEPTSIVA